MANSSTPTTPADPDAFRGDLGVAAFCLREAAAWLEQAADNLNPQHGDTEARSPWSRYDPANSNGSFSAIIDFDQVTDEPGRMPDARIDFSAYADPTRRPQDVPRYYGD